MKKLMSLLLVLGMCLGLTGCGGDSDTKQNSQHLIEFLKFLN